MWAMPITDRGNWRSGSGRKGGEASWEPARDRTRAEAGRRQDKVGHQGRTAPDRGPSNHTLNATHFFLQQKQIVLKRSARLNLDPGRGD